MDLLNYKLQQLTMEIPTLPNDIILKIIKEADGGLNTHKKKFASILQTITGNIPSHWFIDGRGVECPYFWWEQIERARYSGEERWDFHHIRGRDTFTDSEEEYTDSSEEED